MIDTLARHIAALSEARRLVAMILANNPAFKALLHANVGQQTDVIAHLEGLLGSDKVYLAYRQLGDALADVQPVAEVRAHLGVKLSERVALLPALVPSARAASARAAKPCMSNPCDSKLTPGLSAYQPTTQTRAQTLVAPARPATPTPTALGDRLRDVLAATSMPVVGVVQASAESVPRCATRAEASVAIVRREAQAPSAPQSAPQVRATPPPAAPKVGRRLFPSL